MTINNAEVIQIIEKALSLAEKRQLTLFIQSFHDSRDNDTILMRWKEYQKPGVKRIGLEDLRNFNFLDRLSKAIITDIEKTTQAEPEKEFNFNKYYNDFSFEKLETLLENNYLTYVKGTDYFPLPPAANIHSHIDNLALFFRMNVFQAIEKLYIGKVNELSEKLLLHPFRSGGSYQHPAVSILSILQDYCKQLPPNAKPDQVLQNVKSALTLFFDMTYYIRSENSKEITYQGKNFFTFMQEFLAGLSEKNIMHYVKELDKLNNILEMVAIQADSTRPEFKAYYFMLHELAGLKLTKRLSEIRSSTGFSTELVNSLCEIERDIKNALNCEANDKSGELVSKVESIFDDSFDAIKDLYPKNNDPVKTHEKFLKKNKTSENTNAMGFSIACLKQQNNRLTDLMVKSSSAESIMRVSQQMAQAIHHYENAQGLTNVQSKSDVKAKQTEIAKAKNLTQEASHNIEMQVTEELGKISISKPILEQRPNENLPPLPAPKPAKPTEDLPAVPKKFGSTDENHTPLPQVN